MFCVFKLKKICGMFFLLLGVIFIVSSLFCINKGDIAVIAPGFEPTYSIVIDAGHGEPDEG